MVSWNLQYYFPRQAVQAFQTTHQAFAPLLPLSLQPTTGQNQTPSSLYESSRQHFRTGALPYAGDASPQVNTGLYYLAMALQQNLTRMELEHLEILKRLEQLSHQNPASGGGDKPRLNEVG